MDKGNSNTTTRERSEGSKGGDVKGPGPSVLEDVEGARDHEASSARPLHAETAAEKLRNALTILQACEVTALLAEDTPTVSYRDVDAARVRALTLQAIEQVEREIIITRQLRTNYEKALADLRSCEQGRQSSAGASA